MTAQPFSQASTPSAPAGPASGSPLVLRLLGQLEMDWQGQPLTVSAPRLRALLAYLALEGPTSRETLGELFWSGRGSQHLRQALHKLRAAPGAEYWLQADAGQQVSILAQTDMAQIGALLLAGERKQAALRLGSGQRLLPDLELDDAPQFMEWLEEQRTALAELHRAALRAELDGHTEGEDLPAARKLIQALLSLDPADEDTYRVWMQLEAGAGRHEQVTSVFEQCRLALKRELNAEPDETTLTLLAELEGRSALRDQPIRWMPADDSVQQEDGATGALVGRAEEWQAAVLLLEDQGRALLHGLAGIGKTRLAQALGQQLAGQGRRVLWCSLGDDPPASVMAGLLRALGQRGGPATPLSDLQGQVREALKEQPSLILILDDAWNSYTVQTLLEAVPPGVWLLVTSRQRLPGWPRVALDRLPRPDALHLMRHLLAGGPPAPGTDAQLDAMCALLGDHPYALRLAASSLRGGQNLTELLIVVGQAPHALGADLSLEALLRHSVERLDEESHEAYLGMGTLFSPSVTPELLARVLRREVNSTEEALYRLMEHGLVTRQAQPESERVTFGMHDLTWQAARSAQSFLPRSALRAAAEYAQSQSAAPAALALELPNLLGAARLARQRAEPLTLIRLMAGLLGGRYLATHGFPHGNLPLVEAAQTAAVQAQDWPNAALLAGKLGDIYQALLGDAGTGTAWYLAARDHAGDAGLLERQATFTTLAGTLMTMQRRPEAEATLEEAQEYAERSGDTVCLAKVLEQRGVARAMQKDFLGARTLLLEARAVLRPLLMPGHPQVQKTRVAYYALCNNIGQAEQRLGNHHAALDLKREALAVAEELGEGLLIAEAISNIGEVLAHLGQVEQAKAELTRAVEQYRLLGASGREAATLNLIAGLPA